MGFRINTNVVSLNAQRNLNSSKWALDKSLEKISSGQRINRASDDAAGLGVSEELRAEIRGSNQAKRNSEDGVSLIQIAEGALSEVSNILIRLRELAVQASSDTIGIEERRYLNIEFTELKEEIDRIILSTEFNGVQLLDGSQESLDIQVGTGNSSFIDRITWDTSKINIRSITLRLGEVSLASKSSAQNSLPVLDMALAKISKTRSGLGALQNRLQSIISGLEVSVENLSAANSQIRDTDIAKEAAEMTKGNILVRAGTSILAQINQTAANALQLLRTEGG